MTHAKSSEIAKKYGRSQGTVNMSGRTGSMFCGRYKAVVVENNYLKKDRNKEIARRVKAGESLESIAKEYGFKSKYSVKSIDRIYNGCTKERKKEVGFKAKKVNPNDTIVINKEKYTVIKTYPYVVLACKRDRHGVKREYTFSYFEISKGSFNNNSDL